jgi:hypothetical protein
MFGFRGISRRTVPAGLALASVVACSLALPLPVPASKPDSGKPFPCQHHACGCRDAESCWRDCCCFTSQEKLAWAKRHGVTPPSFAIASAKREATGKPACCRRACCLAASAHSHDAGEQAAQPPARPVNGTIILIMALKCHGVQVSVTLMPPSLPVEQGGFTQEWVEFAAASTLLPVFYDPPLMAVATPPPRAAAA